MRFQRVWKGKGFYSTSMALILIVDSEPISLKCMRTMAMTRLLLIIEDREAVKDLEVIMAVPPLYTMTFMNLSTLFLENIKLTQRKYQFS